MDRLHGHCQNSPSDTLLLGDHCEIDPPFHCGGPSRNRRGILGLDLVIDQLDRTTIHYRPFLDIAEKMALSRAVVSGAQKSPSFLIKTSDLFERAVRSAVKEGLGNSGLFVNKARGLGLDATDAGSNRLEPDIIVYHTDRGFLLIADVKYQHLDRLELDRSNMFQINAYLNGYGLDRGSLIYPTDGPFEVRDFKLRWGKTISVFRVPVTSRKSFISGIRVFLEKELGSIQIHGIQNGVT